MRPSARFGSRLDPYTWAKLAHSLQSLLPHMKKQQFTLAILALIFAAATVSANNPIAKPSIKKSLQEYTVKHGYKTRTVTVGPTNRKINRIFVPVLNKVNFEEFTDLFGETSGGVVYRYTPANPHIAAALKSGDAYLWARQRQDLKASWFARGPGYLIAAQLEPLELSHFKGWLAKRAEPGDNLYCTGNCMEWVGNAEVGPQQLIFHTFGITRSKDGGNIKAKMIHAGNERIEVVGVTVESVSEFDAMTDEQLIGKPPAGGVEDAAR